MQANELVARAAELVKACPYLNLATSRGDRPWSSPVYAVYDKDLAFYWSSWKEAVHSVNIASNPVASFTLYDSTRQRGTNNYRCLYVDCTVSIISDRAQAEKVFGMLYPGESLNVEDFLGDGLKRFYKATPTAFSLNCLSERELSPTTIKMRVEVDLHTLRTSI